MLPDNPPVSVRPVHLLRATAVLADTLLGRKPTDQLLDALFKEHRQMGQRDRASVSSVVYGVLRAFRALEWHTGGRNPQALVAAWLRGEHTAPGQMPVAVEANLPDDYYAELRRSLSAEQILALAAALNTAAPVDVRVNSLKASVAAAQAALAEEGVSSSPTPYSPLGLRLQKRTALHTKNSYLHGLIEPQDEGSQLLALLANAQANETVVDYCAGAGGKTLALAASMGNRGRILACDISAARLAKLPVRAARAGVTIVQTLALAPQKIEGLHPWQQRADLVLVDAPCSGSGTLRRNPELRLKALDLPRLHQQQTQILQEAAALVAPNGRLVYATCSLFNAENDDVIADFLGENPRFSIQTPTHLPLGLIPTADFLKLRPDLHGTDGFFAAILRRHS